MATDLKPPEVDRTSTPTTEREPIPPAFHGALAPPPAPPTTEGYHFGPLFGALGILSVVLMVVMLATNYLLLAATRAPAAPADAGAVAAPARPVQSGPATLNVTVSEFKFAPNELQMTGPGDLTVNVKNAGQIEHDFVIEGLDGRLVVPAGQTATKLFPIAKVGIYTFVCSIPGHKEAGMTGKIVVGTPEQASTKPDSSAYGPISKEQPVVKEPAVALKPAAAGVKPLPVAQVAPPVNRSAPQTIKYEVETKEVTAQLADGVTYTYWTFGGTVPGPMLRVRKGDTVEMTLKNPADSKLTHSIDLHAVTGPGGGAKATQIPPGESASFTFKALNPGVYVYHCATPMVANHIANGMYGLIIVEPEGGLPKVDREFYVMEGDFYTSGARGQEGQHDFSLDKMLREQPEYVLFNGGVGQLVGDGALKAKVGETVRIFFGVGGPNLTSSFHVIGEIFDRVYPEGSTEPLTNVQTTLVPSGGAVMVEFKAEVPGTYTLVDHSLGRLEKGAAGQLVVEGAENPEVFKVVKAGAHDAGH